MEQENARLLALTQNGSAEGSSPHPTALVSEIEKLRAQLAAAQARENELAAELNAKAGVPETRVKVEAPEPETYLSASRSSSLSPHKSAASLGLMVSPTFLSVRFPPAN